MEIRAGLAAESAKPCILSPQARLKY